MIIRMSHARAIICPNGKGYCAEGMRLFAARHGFDYCDFALNGIDSERLLATGDAMAIRVVELAQKEHDGQQQETDAGV